MTSGITTATGSVSAEAQVSSAGIIQRLALRWGLPFHSGMYFAAIAVTFFLQFVQNLYAAKVLGPAFYGIWNIFAITFSYSLLVHAGALNGLAREFPRAAADGNQHEMQELVRSACWINSLGTILFAVAAIFVLHSVFPSIPQVTWRMLLLFAAFLLLQGWTNFLIFVYRARDQFSLLARFIILINAVVLLGAFVFIPRWGLEGFVLAYALGFLVGPLVQARTAPSLSLSLPTWSVGRNLLSIGAPILLFTLTTTINWTMDRLLIARFLGLVEVGYFAIASFALRLLTYVPEMISQVMYPQWAVAKLSRNGASSGLAPGPFRVAFWMMPLLGGLAYYACFSIPLFLPKYTASVLPSQVLCIAAPLMGVGYFCGAYLGASGQEKTALRAQLALLALRVIVVGGALMLGGTLVRAAFASGFSGVIFGVAVLWTTARQFSARGKFMLNGILPSLLCTGWLLLIELLRREVPRHLLAGSSSMILGALVFLLGSLVFLRVLRRQSNLPLLVTGHESKPATSLT